MPRWVGVFLTVNFLLWGAVFGAALCGTAGVEIPAGAGFAVAICASALYVTVTRRRRQEARG
jgi:UPF0716 family protein affecting phage T7 exclusion